MLMMVSLGLVEGEVLIHLYEVMWGCVCNAVDAADDDGVVGVNKLVGWLGLMDFLLLRRGVQDR